MIGTTIEFHDYILTHFEGLGEVICKEVNKNYIVYLNNVPIAIIFSDRLLFRMTPNNKKYNLPKAVPYERANLMYLLTDITNRQLIQSVIKDTYNDLVEN